MLIDDYVQEIADLLGIALTNEIFIAIRRKIAEYAIAATLDTEITREAMIITGNIDLRDK